jgi:signal transduction histidine kinase
MPKILKVIVFGVSAVSIILVRIVGAEFKMIMVLAEILIMLATFVAATGIAGWAAVRRRNIDARLLIPPFFLVICFVARDLAVALGIYSRSMLVTPYARPFILAAVMLMLMRRLASTLSDLDLSNEILNTRLAVREAELVELHRAERDEAARLVREEERQRLTRDLHDGISGHLASIIAMAERPGSDLKPIEEAAREALDDLRLVIYSLDLGDRELPLALASFRERLVPQLRRLGVKLDWSTADLPEVSGVTPGNALAILRILQETITNAIKHGPASTITVRASAVPNGRVAIVVENDGRPFTPGKGGLGLENMRQRARQLHGAMQVRSLDHGVSVTLLLPSRLPDFEIDPAPGGRRAVGIP